MCHTHMSHLHSSNEYLFFTIKLHPHPHPSHAPHHTPHPLSTHTHTHTHTHTLLTPHDSPPHRLTSSSTTSKILALAPLMHSLAPFSVTRSEPAPCFGKLMITPPFSSDISRITYSHTYIVGQTDIQTDTRTRNMDTSQ